MSTIHVPLDRILPNPWQTRQGTPDPGYIKELALDIATNGLLQIPVGRLCVPSQIVPGSFVPTNLDAYRFDNWGSIEADNTNLRIELAFGHNRLAAFYWLHDLRDNSNTWGNYSTMPVELRPITDEQMAVMAWSENEKRRDTTPIERARAIQKRLDDFRWSHEQAAERLGLSRPVISNALRLLKLPAEVQDDLHTGHLSERQAMALLPLFDVATDIASAESFQLSVTMILGMARQGSSSEILRQRVQEAIDYLHNQVQPSIVTEPTPPAPAPAQPERTTSYTPGATPERSGLSPASAPMSVDAARRPAPAPEPSRPIPPANVDLQNDEDDTDTHESQATPTTPEPAPEPAPTALAWEQVNVVLTVTYLPGQSPRSVVISMRAGSEAPVMHFAKETDVLLSGVMAGMLLDLRQSYQNQ